jgi:hypothetical protein
MRNGTKGLAIAAILQIEKFMILFHRLKDWKTCQQGLPAASEMRILHDRKKYSGIFALIKDQG